MMNNGLPMHLLVSIAPLIAEEYTGSELVRITSAFAVDFNIKGNLPTTAPGVTKRDLLVQNLGPFTAPQQYTILKDLINENEKLTQNPDIARLMSKIPPEVEEAEQLQFVPEKQKQAREELAVLMQNYPNAFRAWQDVYMHRNRNDFRDALDNARLALELLLKDILHNGRSLENQRSDLSIKFSQADISKYFANSVWSILDSYSKLQNNEAKHGLPTLEEQELDFMLNQTATLIRYLIKRFG